jgi:hypothetical protein
MTPLAFHYAASGTRSPLDAPYAVLSAPRGTF